MLHKIIYVYTVAAQDECARVCMYHVHTCHVDPTGVAWFACFCDLFFLYIRGPRYAPRCTSLFACMSFLYMYVHSATTSYVIKRFRTRVAFNVIQFILFGIFLILSNTRVKYNRFKYDCAA